MGTDRSINFFNASRMQRKSLFTWQIILKIFSKMDPHTSLITENRTLLFSVMLAYQFLEMDPLKSQQNIMTESQQMTD
jgi:hypothetical protein